MRSAAPSDVRERLPGRAPKGVSFQAEVALYRECLRDLSESEQKAIFHDTASRMSMSTRLGPTLAA